MNVSIKKYNLSMIDLVYLTVASVKDTIWYIQVYCNLRQEEIAKNYNSIELNNKCEPNYQIK